MRFFFSRQWILCCLALAWLLMDACNSNVPPPVEAVLTADSLVTAVPDTVFGNASESGGASSAVPAKMAKLDIENPDLFSPEFLQALANSGLAEHFELTDSFLIVNHQDTIAFYPQDLPLHEWRNFAAIKGGYLYSLDVARVNLSDLEFNFELLKSGTPVDQIKGKAQLVPAAIILAAEAETDDRTGEGYLSTTYVFEDERCRFDIRIGGEEGELKVKVIKMCKSGKFDIELDKCPTLLEK